MSGQPIDIHYAKMKEWLEDRASLFGKKHAKELQLCLGLAPELVQAVRYDIPALRKTVGRLINQRSEAMSSLDDAPRAEEQHREHQRQMLSSYGISFTAFEQRGAELETLLDQRIAEVECSISLLLADDLPRVLPKCFELYTRQLEQVHFAADSPLDSVAAQHFPWLSRAMDEAHLLASAAQLRTESNAATRTAAEEVDPTVDIDWGDDAADVVDGAGEVVIAWDDAPDDAADAGCAPTVSSGDSECPPPQNLSGAPSVVVARPDHRAALVSELTALTSFLEESILDTLQRDGVTDSADARLRHCPSQVSHISDVSALIKRLTVGNEANLLRMRNNFRLKEKFINGVEDIDRSIARVRARASTADQRISTMDDELAALRPQIDALVQTCKAHQRACEEALQRVFPDREVLIVGDINSL